MHLSLCQKSKESHFIDVFQKNNYQNWSIYMIYQHLKFRAVNGMFYCTVSGEKKALLKKSTGDIFILIS